MRIAITRPVSPTLAQCELTHLERQPIDVARAELQHDHYERSLAALGCSIVRIEAKPHLPDAVFVEDAAVVLDELAIITRPGAASRRAETESVATALKQYRPLRSIREPATLDGGDVLRVDRTLYVGRSQRTNDGGIAQLRQIAGEFGFRVVPVSFGGCLHLKSAVTAIAERTLLLNPEWIEATAFRGLEIVEVDPGEPFAANALLLDATLLYSASHQRTRERLESRGNRVEAIDLFELEKAEAGVTCCSVIVEA
jgi:dimethylargininase